MSSEPLPNSVVTEPLPAAIPVTTATGRTGVIVAVEGSLFVVEHGDGTRQKYSEKHLTYTPSSPGALYLSAMQFEEVVKTIRGGM